MSKYYIAYGSNMNLEQMARRCPTAERIGIGKVKGYELQFKGAEDNSYATISKQQNREVNVLLWKIEENDELSLDRYEGYPIFYGKQELSVELDNGTVVKGMAYIMDPKQKFGWPSKQYFQTIKQGYLENDIDVSSLLQALKINQEHVYEQDQQFLQQEM